MDTTVNHLGGLVVAALRRAGYAESTIGQYEKTIRTLDEFVDGRGGAYTKNLGAVFASLTTSPRTGGFSAQRRFNYMRLVTLFDALIDTGAVSLGTRKRGGGGRHPVTDVFLALDAERGLADATREAYGRTARSYLVFLEEHGIVRLEDADAGTITGFLESWLDRWAKSSLFWVVSHFRPFLIFIGRRDLVDALSLVGIRRSHPVLPVMADEDVQRVVTACAAPLVVSARDAGITLLALLTGLRACDIIDLRLGDTTNARSCRRDRAYPASRSSTADTGLGSDSVTGAPAETSTSSNGLMLPREQNAVNPSARRCARYSSTRSEVRSTTTNPRTVSHRLRCAIT